jgi:hypothetical protein
LVIFDIQDSQGTRKAYLAETMEEQRIRSDGTRVRERAKEAIINLVGLSFFPPYQTMGPLASTLFLLFIWGMVRLVVTIINVNDMEMKLRS